ncbi:MAG: response regulator [Nitrospirae bacterium YQR-1]
MRILIAEDDFVSRSMLHRFLEDYGDVDVAVNGAEAVKFFVLAMDENNPYDVIFLDVIMPEMDGLEALGKIRIKEKSMGIASDKEVKIIMITSLDFLAGILDAYRKRVVRCNDYITKPVDLQELSEILGKYGFSKE